MLGFFTRKDKKKYYTDYQKLTCLKVEGVNERNITQPLWLKNETQENLYQFQL